MFIHEMMDVCESSFADTTCLPALMMLWISYEALLSTEAATVSHTIHKDKDWNPIYNHKNHTQKKNIYATSTIKSEMKGIPQAYALNVPSSLTFPSICNIN